MAGPVQHRRAGHQRHGRAGRADRPDRLVLRLGVADDGERRTLLPGTRDDP